MVRIMERISAVDKVTVIHRRIHLGQETQLETVNKVMVDGGTDMVMITK